MADGLKKAAAWLGLVSDDRYAAEDHLDGAEELTEQVYTEQDDDADPRAVEHTGNVAQVKRWQQPDSFVPAQGATVVRPAQPQQPPRPEPAAQTADLSRIITVHPRTYNEARTIGEHFRDNIPVIMNLTDMEDVDAKRLVDFAAGLVFGLRGTIERVTSKVFLLSPQNVSVAAEDKERIAGSFFNQS